MMHAITLVRDIVTFSMPAVPDVAEECVFTCTIPERRVNRNNELWVELTNPACQYMSSVIASYDEPMDADNEDGVADSDAEGNDDYEADVHNESREDGPAPSTPKPEQAEATIDEVVSAEVVPTVEPESAVKVTSTELKSKVQTSLATFFTEHK